MNLSGVDMSKRKLIMMVGVPMSGKDHWIREHFNEVKGLEGVLIEKSTQSEFEYVSSDDIISEKAESWEYDRVNERPLYDEKSGCVHYQNALTYGDWHPKKKPVSDLYQAAKETFLLGVQFAIEDSKNILVNRTNTTVKERAEILDLLEKSGKAEEYDIEIQVARPRTGVIIQRWQQDNPKQIPNFVIASKLEGFEKPTRSEHELMKKASIQRIPVPSTAQHIVADNPESEKYAESDVVKSEWLEDASPIKKATSTGLPGK